MDKNELPFDSLNTMKNINFLEAQSPEELMAQIVQIKMPIRILSIYYHGTRHIAWVQGNFKKKIKGV
jgi:hypothetical protein